MAGYSSAVFTILLMTLYFIVYTVMLVLGALHLQDCIIEPWIPLFLVVAGAAGLMCLLLSIVAFDAQRGTNGKHAPNVNLAKMSIFIVALLTIFSFVWNVAGSFWVFPYWAIYGANIEQQCHKDTYLYAFVYLIIFWVTFPCQLGGMVAKWKFQQKWESAISEEDEP